MFMKPPRLESAPCAAARKGGRSALSVLRSAREGFYFLIIKKHLLGADELRRGRSRPGCAPVMLCACRVLFMHQMWAQVFPGAWGGGAKREQASSAAPFHPPYPSPPTILKSPETWQLKMWAREQQQRPGAR